MSPWKLSLLSIHAAIMQDFLTLWAWIEIFKTVYIDILANGSLGHTDV